MRNNKKYIKEEPKDRKITVPGIQNDVDTTADSVGRAEFLLKQVKGRLSSLGFDVDDLEKQKTIQQLMAAPFGFTFSLVWPEKNEWGEKGPVTNINGKEIKGNIDTRAKVVNPNKDGGLIIETKEPSLQIYFFDEKELNRTLGGGEGKLPPGKKGENFRRLLEEGVTYKVKINQPILRDTDVEGDKSEVDKEVTDDKNSETDISVPKEIASGKNRNEIFRFLLNRFGGYKGKIVYGDGFKTPEEVKEYNRLQRAVKAGKEDKSKLKEFRDKSSRSPYSIMIANLRKSYPSTFMKKLSKAFPEFNIKYTKESFNESLTSQPLLEEDNPDKYKRWSLVFSNKVIGKDNIDELDKNIQKFMAAVKKWFAIPVIGSDGKKRSYNISYDEDKVNDYWNKFYGTKKESKISLYNILSEMIKEDSEEKSVKPDYILLKIMNGGLETIDEDEEVVADRKAGKTKSRFETDALIISNIGKFIKNGNLEGVPNKEQKILPGAGNKVIPGLEDKHLMCDIIKLSGEGGTISNDSEIKIKTKDGSDIEGLDELNRTINEVIKSGKMSYDTNFKGEHIVLKYPSKTPLSDRINVVWSQS